MGKSFIKKHQRKKSAPNLLDYESNTKEYYVQKEIFNKNMENKPIPDKCPKCGTPLNEGPGYVGETVLFCPKGHGVFWEDSEDAIRRVL